MMEDEFKGKGLVIAAILLTLGMLGGSYLLAQVDYSPKVDVTGGPTNPTVYVSSTPPEHAIHVSASASDKVAPDLLNLQLRVQTESTNAADSSSNGISRKKSARIHTAKGSVRATYGSTNP